MEEFPRQSGRGNYYVKMLLSDSGDDPGEFSSPGIERMEELDPGLKPMPEMSDFQVWSMAT